MEPGSSQIPGPSSPNSTGRRIERRRSTGDMHARSNNLAAHDRARRSVDEQHQAPSDRSSDFLITTPPVLVPISHFTPSPSNSQDQDARQAGWSDTDVFQRQSRLRVESFETPLSDFDLAFPESEPGLYFGDVVVDHAGLEERASTRIDPPDLPPPNMPPLPRQAPVRNPTVLDFRRRQSRGFRRFLQKVSIFFGYGTGNRARKELVSLIWNLSFNFVQFVFTITLVTYSGFHHSPRDHSISEWKACDKALGPWNCIWLFKIIFDCVMTYWGFRRDRKIRVDQTRRINDPESRPDSHSADNPLPDDASVDIDRGSIAEAEERRRAQSLPFSRLYSKLSTLLSTILISWFITANVFVYGSVHTCRFTSPHLWWLSFAILCIHYFMIVEIFLIALVVFIIGPLIYLFWNILLMCLGRHPLQNPHYINPEIGKLSKSIVENIPLVLYIPPPPEGEGKDVIAIPTAAHTKSSSSEHTYPPKPSPPVPKRRFTFIRMRSSKSTASASGIETGKGEKTPDSESPPKWEDRWEHGDYPFVRLEGNRAACAICLMDFQEPKRVSSEVIKSWISRQSADVPREAVSSETQSEVTPELANDGPTIEISEVSTREDRNPLLLEDAGEGAQPLRLLPCGHVFHKTCIDPWLCDVSGRCPTCQRPVILPDPPQSKKRERNR